MMNNKNKFKNKEWKFSKKQVQLIYLISSIISGLFLGLALLSTYLIAGLPNDNAFVLFVKEQKFYFPFFMTIGFICLVISMLTLLPNLKTLWRTVAKMHQYGDLNKEEFEALDILVEQIRNRYISVENIKAIINTNNYKTLDEELKKLEQQEKQLKIQEQEQKVKRLEQEVIKDDKTRVQSDY